MYSGGSAPRTFKVPHQVPLLGALCVLAGRMRATTSRGKSRRRESRSRNKVRDIIVEQFWNSKISFALRSRVCAGCNEIPERMR